MRGVLRHLTSYKSKMCNKHNRKNQIIYLRLINRKGMNSAGRTDHARKMWCLSMFWKGISSKRWWLHVPVYSSRRVEAEWDLRISHVCDKIRYDVWNGINCEIQSQRLGFWKWAIITEVTNSRTCSCAQHALNCIGLGKQRVEKYVCNALSIALVDHSLSHSHFFPFFRCFRDLFSCTLHLAAFTRGIKHWNSI
jgi:hypothetical protein